MQLMNHTAKSQQRISMLTTIPTLYAISDFRDGWPPTAELPAKTYYQHWQATNPIAQVAQRWCDPQALETARTNLHVNGGYMERLPLACLRYGLVDYAEKWHYVRTPTPQSAGLEQPLFGCRAFHLHNECPPFESTDMLEFIHASGAPHILCTWGLGVSERVMQVCAESFKVYYSLDAPPLRVPPEVSRYFDLILVGSEQQRATVHERHPDIPCEILTLGPEFADFETFRPLDLPKDYDLIYVACAQDYKRHDVLFEAMARCARRVRCLCVFGYGDKVDELHAYAQRLNIDVDFIDPPGVPFAEINRLMNRAKIGVVAGINDGCPAILTEYMLAGLPVLANGDLCCGLRFITPQTGLSVSSAVFDQGITYMLDHLSEFDPRPYAIEHCGWPTSVQQFADMLNANGYKR